MRDAYTLARLSAAELVERSHGLSVQELDAGSMVMELMRGGSLADLLRRGRPSIDHTVRLGREIALGFVKRGANQIGTRLSARTAEGAAHEIEVVALPFR